ncbi:MAG: hypothetical protein GX673_04915 [Gammaproteobacteria bacterium]|nr:hypothetical protein [Gammaproteobacteria bacterium]
MKLKSTYADLPQVAEFIEWLASELDSQELFRHAYIDRRSGAKWQCTSLFDAYQGYAWNHPGNQRLDFKKGNSVQSNVKALDALRHDLLAAGEDDERTLQAAVDVMAWGGVTAHNAQWFQTHRVGLAKKLNDVKKAFMNNDFSAPVLRSDDLRFNSGMTKVYSLMCPDFVIYDSRVAAALGMLVVKYCQAQGLTKIPESLCFPWAGAKEAVNSLSPKRRNPSTGSLKFQRLRAGSHHALWNMRCNWVLNQVLKHPLAAKSAFQSIAAPQQPVRAIEQALFMIGYDLGANEIAAAV